MLKPFGKCLCPTLGLSRNGKYVVHEKNHFLAASVCNGEARVHMSNRPHETEYLSSTHGPWDCIYELQNISQLSGSTAATAENMKSDLRGGSSRIPGLSISESCRKGTRREKSVLVISWRWTNVLMLHPCLRKLLPDPSQADVSCRAWEAQLRLRRRAFSSIAGIRRDNVSALLQDSFMQKTFITLFIDVLDTTQDSALRQRAAASILAHARWPCHLPRGSVPLRIETCIPEAFLGFLVAEMEGVCLYCPMDAGGRRMSQPPRVHRPYRQHRPYKDIRPYMATGLIITGLIWQPAFYGKEHKHIRQEQRQMLSQKACGQEDNCPDCFFGVCGLLIWTAAQKLSAKAEANACTKGIYIGREQSPRIVF